MRRTEQFADLVLYPVSPTISVPATFPMLEPHADDRLDKDKDEEGESLS